MTLNCISHAGRFECKGTCRTQHLKFVEISGHIEDAVKCQYYHEVV